MVPQFRLFGSKDADRPGIEDQHRPAEGQNWFSGEPI
jgi:hypothetical protein